MLNHDIFKINTQSDIISCINTLKNASKGFDANRVQQILMSFHLPVTIIIENLYNDKTYRDSYYHHFSSKYSNYSKTCKRLAIFESLEVEIDDFFTQAGHEKLQHKFIGTIVLKPIYPGTIGKTLLNPSKINSFTGCVRTTNFDSVVLGANLHVKTFPFSSQDSETMTCAETAIWSLMKYYGSRYSMYKVALPSDIHKVTDGTSFQRVLPSMGLVYAQSSSALKSFGFHPRYYQAEPYDASSENIKETLYYYMASGIPTLCGVNLHRTPQSLDGHLVVCIGYSDNINYVKAVDNICDDNKTIFWDKANMIDDYHFMDDNQVPFAMQSFYDFSHYTSSSIYNKTNIKYLIIPLYKRIFLTAENASTYFYSIFKNSFIGLCVIKNFTGPYIINIFLASSRKYKHFRSLEHSNKLVAERYIDLPLPKFIWIAEIGTKDTISNNEVIGEVLLDATASGNNLDESIISIHYPGVLACRYPDQSFSDMMNSNNIRLFTPTKMSYKQFNQNLHCT